MVVGGFFVLMMGFGGEGEERAGEERLAEAGGGAEGEEAAAVGLDGGLR